jgi:NAD(P)H-flavin reductase/ferredoxin
MIEIRYQDHEKDTQILLADNQTVLEGLLNANIDIPNACRAGACQACKLQALEGQPPSAAQLGLSSAEKTLGYFLSCCCKPTEPLIIAAGATNSRYLAKVLCVQRLNDKVLRVRLDPVFDFLPGQYFTIWHQGHIPRSYSIASSKEDGYIECHIHYIEGGVFSRFAFNALTVGDTLELQGPLGTCIYSPSSTVQPLLLVGISTGLAPLYGILQQALASGHQGPIHLICAAKNASGIYLVDDLRELEQKHSHLRVEFIVQTDSPTASISQAIVKVCDIYQYCREQHPSTKGYGIYLCGAQSFVTKLKKQCFLAGANMQEIHADAFLACS